MQRIWIWKPFNTRPRIQILCIFTVWKVWKYLVVSVEEIKCHILATSIQSRTLRIQFFLLLNYLVLRQKKYFGVILPSVSFQNVFLQSIFFQTCIFVKYTWLLALCQLIPYMVIYDLNRIWSIFTRCMDGGGSMDGGAFVLCGGVWTQVGSVSIGPQHLKQQPTTS